MNSNSFLISYYLLRLYFYEQQYVIFIVAGFLLFLGSYFVAYYLYPSTPHDRVNLPYFVANRLYVFSYVLLTEFFLSQNKTKSALRELKIQQQISLLNNQINPHLLFNEFNHLHYHVLSKSDKASEVLVKLSELMRYSLKITSNNFIPAKEELYYLQCYIELEKLRLEDQVEVYFEVNIKEEALLPVMVLIVLVENAFKYGVGSNPTEKQHLFFMFDLSKERFLFKTKNRKIAEGTNNWVSTKTGLKNV